MKKIKVKPFKDQPDGKCWECKWNVSANDLMDCICPPVKIVNAICIQKTIMTSTYNTQYYLEERE